MRPFVSTIFKYKSYILISKTELTPGEVENASADEDEKVQKEVERLLQEEHKTSKKLAFISSTMLLSLIF